jgi:predicted nucleotidyltransferase
MGLLKLIKGNSTDIDPLYEANQVISKIKMELPLKSAYLFGSSVNGNFTVDSDLDIILIFSDSENLTNIQKKLYSKRWSHIAIDFIMQTESNFEKRKDLGGVCFIAFNEGIKLL